jgi:hypothetical protein
MKWEEARDQALEAARKAAFGESERRRQEELEQRRAADTAAKAEAAAVELIQPEFQRAVAEFTQRMPRMAFDQRVKIGRGLGASRARGIYLAAGRTMFSLPYDRGWEYRDTYVLLTSHGEILEQTTRYRRFGWVNTTPETYECWIRRRPDSAMMDRLISSMAERLALELL